MSVLRERRFWDLFAASFGALFFELLLVRWLPTEIYYLGYYKNCILFATFLGYGIGCATHYRFDRLIPHFALSLPVLVLVVGVVEDSIRILPWKTGEFLWLHSMPAGVEVPILVFLLVTFAVAALLMVPLGYLVGKNLGRFSPIPAYSINVGASLLGVGCFLILGHLRLGPVIWFGILFLPILFFTRQSRRGLAATAVAFAAVVALLLHAHSPSDYWSPYHKINLWGEPHPLINASLLSTNNNGHQTLYDLSPARLAQRGRGGRALWIPVVDHLYEYESAYSLIEPRSVLIVGGGTGNEAAAALRRGVERVDVVEIDPVIIELGRRHHPERPYDSPRVTLITDDARHYMATTAERYDLIIFGFLDSTSHLSSFSHIRLDNYVYTVESLQRARTLLKPDGLLQVTYFAHARFVRARIFAMLREAFGADPLVFTLEPMRGAIWAYRAHDTIFFVGPAVHGLESAEIAGLRQISIPPQEEALLLATDDWPFLSVPTRSIGRDYVIGLAAMAGISALLIYAFVWRGKEWRAGAVSGLFFLQGAGFMLLETNTITQMALLLGSTWIVTSLAIVLVLLAALVANYVVHRYASPGFGVILGFLAAGLLLNYFVDLQTYFAMPFTVPLAAFQVYLPILGSSLLFARLFQRSQQSNVDFGMNILGALFGGILEYSSLVVGIRSIYLLAIGIFLAFALLQRRARA